MNANHNENECFRPYGFCFAFYFFCSFFFYSIPSCQFTSQPDSTKKTERERKMAKYKIQKKNTPTLHLSFPLSFSFLLLSHLPSLTLNWMFAQTEPALKTKHSKSWKEKQKKGNYKKSVFSPAYPLLKKATLILF